MTDMPKQARTLIESDEIDAAVSQPEPDGTVDPEPPVAAEPKPKPGDADYDWTQDYGDADLFYYTFLNGKTIALKSMAAIFSKTWMYKIRRVQTNAQLMVVTLERAGCDNAHLVMGDLDDTEGDPLDDMWQAYQGLGTAHSEGAEGLTPGE